MIAPHDFDRVKSLAHAFQERVQRDPSSTLWAYPVVEGEKRRWVEVSTSEVAEKVNALATYLEKLGVRKGDSIAIISNTRPEWMIADFAILSAAGVTVSVYPSLTWREIGFILYDSNSTIAIVENQEQVDKLVKLTTTPCPIPEREVGPEEEVSLSFKKIIAIEEVTPHPLVMQLSEIYTAYDGSSTPRGMEELRREDLAAIVYTSGTTGAPKGVLQTHHNHLSNIRQGFEGEIYRTDGTLFLFLPLSHAFARLMGYLGVLTHAGLRFTRVTDKKSSKIDLNAVTADILDGQSAYIPTVPRLFEKMRAGIEAAMQQRSVSSFILRACITSSIAHYRSKVEGKPLGLWKTIVYNATEPVRQKLRNRLFGSKFRHAISGGAKLVKDVHEFFEAIGIDIYEGYGLTETCVATHVNRMGRKRVGSVGTPFNDVEVKIEADGEILVKGPNVTKGYHNRPKATAEAWDQEGWFHTGDIGHVDAEGYLYITDRKKDIIVTAGGKKIPPQLIESKLKKIPGISQVMVYGDGKPFCIALFTIDRSTIIPIMAARGVERITEPEKDPSVRQYIQDNVNRINSEVASYEQVKKIETLPEDLTIENNLLTPTQKPRRRAVELKYRELIERLYIGGKQE